MLIRIRKFHLSIFLPWRRKFSTHVKDSKIYIGEGCILHGISSQTQINWSFLEYHKIVDLSLEELSLVKLTNFF